MTAKKKNKDHSGNCDNCTVFHFGRLCGCHCSSIYGARSDYTVILGHSACTLPIRVRTQCSVWRLQCVGGLEVSQVSPDWYSYILICIGSHTRWWSRLDVYACRTRSTHHEGRWIELTRCRRVPSKQTASLMTVTHTGTLIATESVCENCERP